jgi:transposase
LTTFWSICALIVIGSRSRSCGMATKKYRRDLRALEQRRRKGTRMLARGVMQAEVARLLEVSRQTVSNWAHAQADDAQSWRRKPLGRPAGLSAADKAQLSKRLIAGAVASGFPTELWTLARVGVLLQNEFGRSYGTTQVWRLLRALGFSSQRPTGRAIQRDEPAILTWKKRRWPALKKSAAPKAVPSSSSTSRD